MLRIIDMLKASADRKMIFDLEAVMDGSDKPATSRSDDIQEESERSRSPAAMRRQAVRTDLAKMMRAFGIKPDNLPLYQDELVEAEYTCALCRHVGRCRAWSAKGCQGDAPRLFCANAALFEEITPDSSGPRSRQGAGTRTRGRRRCCGCSRPKVRRRPKRHRDLVRESLSVSLILR